MDSKIMRRLCSGDRGMLVQKQGSMNLFGSIEPNDKAKLKESVQNLSDL
jgi:hypothetical protein